MNSHLTTSFKPTLNASALLADRERGDRLLFIAIFVATVSLVPLLVLSGAKFGFSATLGLSLLLVVVVSIVRWPIVGMYVIFGCALLIEQGPLVVNGVGFYFYVFYWPPNLAGLIERPIGFLILFIFLVLICHRLATHQRLLEWGKLLPPLALLLLCIAWGIFHGLTTGGNLKVVVEEVRPFWYLSLSYLLAYNLITHIKHVRGLFWLMIVSSGIKGLQGVYIYFVVLHGNLVGVNEILAHEESFFFVALILLILLFCLHYCYRPQLYAALLLLPVVLISLIANQRRADYIALVFGVFVAWTLVFLVKPSARKWLLASALVFILLGAAYVVAFANSSGGLGEPARAIISIINPSYANARDAASNLYRLIEDYDLKYTVQLNPLGLGFGKQFLTPIPLPDISQKDPIYLYVPHNTIYWIWMRLGSIGYFALWFLFGAIIVRGSLIARRLRDPYLQLAAIFIVAITFMEIIVAFADYQLYFFRNVIYLGMLAGMLMRLPYLETNTKEVA